MRRALTILKYLPAVLCGLLVVAWVVSLYFDFGAALNVLDSSGGERHLMVSTRRGDLATNVVYTANPRTRHPIVMSFLHRSAYKGHGWLGGFRLGSSSYETWFDVPIPFLLTLLLPLAIGPFIRFRFPLWSWFAFTALVAVELAYYLR